MYGPAGPGRVLTCGREIVLFGRIVAVSADVEAPRSSDSYSCVRMFVFPEDVGSSSGTPSFGDHLQRHVPGSSEANPHDRPEGTRGDRPQRRWRLRGRYPGSYRIAVEAHQRDGTLGVDSPPTHRWRCIGRRTGEPPGARIPGTREEGLKREGIR